MMNAERSESGRSVCLFIVHHSSFIVLTVVFLIMLRWSWFSWPDPIVDFGRELYVPWQLTEGKVLYRDIAYFNGPLSPYFNALVFTILGVSLRSIVIVNLLILMGLIVMVWRLWSQMADRLTATAACVVLLMLFAFIQLLGIGNYNFVTPYSHEITHGVVLSFSGISVLCRRGTQAKSRLMRAGLAGLILGLVFLTKAEVFLAAAVAMGVGVILIDRQVRAAAIFLLGALIPPLVAWALLSMSMSAGEALVGVLGAWNYVFDSRIAGMLFYRKVLGTDELGTNLLAIVAQFAAYAAVLAPALVLGLRRRGSSGTAVSLAMAGFVLVILLALWGSGVVQWEWAFRGTTLAMVVIVGGLVVSLNRKRKEQLDPKCAMRLVVSIFALVLLAKMFFSVRLFQYGFALAMPATLACVAAIVSWLPSWIDSRGGCGLLLRNTAIAAIAFVVFVHLEAYGRLFAFAPLGVGGGADRFYGRDARSQAVNLMLDALSSLPAEATLAVVPEGVMVNYLSRRSNPIPYFNLMPPEVLIFGQQRIVGALAEHPPDYIVLVRGSDPVEYGFKSFAADYGAEIFRWIAANYVELPTAQERRYPMMLLRRK